VELGKFGPGSKARGAAHKPAGIRSGVEAALQNPSQHSRPAATRRLAQQLQPDQAEGQTGLFGIVTSTYSRPI